MPQTNLSRKAHRMDNPNEEIKPEEPTPEAYIAPPEMPEEEESDTFHSRKNILRLASWANVISWIVAIIYLILFAARLYFDFQQGIQFSVITALTWISYFSTLLIGLIWFVVLQGLAEGLYLLLDLFDNQ
jgi:hypothetical protein